MTTTTAASFSAIVNVWSPSSEEWTLVCNLFWAFIPKGGGVAYLIAALPFFVSHCEIWTCLLPLVSFTIPLEAIIHLFPFHF
jgi:hypothetical protein